MFKVRNIFSNVEPGTLNLELSRPLTGVLALPYFTLKKSADSRYQNLKLRPSQNGGTYGITEN
jgi:hypothetical protein